MTRRRLVLITMVLALALVGLFAVTPIVRVPASVQRSAERGREHLFSETDYGELLAACRGLLGQMPSDESVGRSYRVCLGKRDPETFMFPQVILDLEPAFVAVCPGIGSVRIELYPGPGGYGVIAFSERYEGYGAVELTDRLWYFDRKYGGGHSRHAKKIATMIEEGRRKKEARQSVPTPQP